MSKNNDTVFRDAPIPKAVAQMAVPTMLSMLVVVLYNMVDTFFVGQTGDANQVAAVSVATPVFLILMALGNMFGIGGSSLISRLLGAGEGGRAKQACAFCCYGSLALGVVMIFVFLAAMPFILSVIGTSANTVGYARDYLFWISLGAPFIIFANAFCNLIRGEGAATASMVGNMIGTVVNIILDPIMILSLDWGVAGAAIATVIGNICACVFYLCYFLRGRTVLSIRPRDFAVRGVIGSVVAIGLPASLNNILMSLTNILLNNFLAAYGDNAVAGMGVAMKANMLVVFVQLGLAMGVQPLIGYAYGAVNIKRLRGVVNFSVVCTTVMARGPDRGLLLRRGPHHLGVHQRRGRDPGGRTHAARADGVRARARRPVRAAGCPAGHGTRGRVAGAGRSAGRASCSSPACSCSTPCSGWTASSSPSRSPTCSPWSCRWRCS